MKLLELGLSRHCHVALHTSCVPTWEPAPERPGLVLSHHLHGYAADQKPFYCLTEALDTEDCLFEKGIWQTVPEFVSLGLLSNSTTLNLELWSLSGPAAASWGPVPVVARATKPRALNFPQLSG